MRFQVVLKKSDEGYAAWCPALHGCNSQGQTEAEALTNIRQATSEYLAAVDELTARDRRATRRFTSWKRRAPPVPKLPGVKVQDVVRAFERAGFAVVRQSGHVIMSNGVIHHHSARTIPSMRLRWPGSSLMRA